MQNFILNFSDPFSFEKRRNKDIMYVFLISIITFIVAFSMFDWKTALIISGSIFSVQLYKSYRNNKYFITYIEIGENFLVLKYKIENELREITAKKMDFDFRKKHLFSRSKVVCFLVFYRGEKIVRQFEIGEWDEKKMDNIILKFHEDK